MTTRDQLIEKQILRVRDVIRRQHKAISTENCYLGWLRRYFLYVFGLPRVAAAVAQLFNDLPAPAQARALELERSLAVIRKQLA